MDFLQHLAEATIRETPPGPTSKALLSAVKTVLLTDMENRPKPAAEIFKSLGNLLILGAPGAGKTTLLRSRSISLANN